MHASSTAPATRGSAPTLQLKTAVSLASDILDQRRQAGPSTLARVLGLYVRELKLISLEDAIRKMTSLPAQTFGFRDRGLIREGFAADVVIFDENKIKDQATFDKPHQFPVGISYVIVNGQLVLADDQMTPARPGC